MKALACRITLLMLSAFFVQGASAQRVFKDCPSCPEMVVIPAGSFPMGGDTMFSNFVLLTELPQHRVQIRSFAIGKYEVTQEQWFAVMDNNPSANRGRQLPVENVSWDEVQEFIAKLNQKTGRRYRLPSEAEWEYAARAGTTAEWSHGNDESKLVNYAWYNENSLARTHEVGQKLPNAFGLYDMHGNVLEWLQDCWHENYAGAPIDGSAWTTDCGMLDKVYRGGSWYMPPDYLRTTARDSRPPDFRFKGIGFRLASDL